MDKGRAAYSWLMVGALIVLLGVLAFLQYRWIGEVSVATRERLKGSLQASLNRLSQEFDSEITTACAALMPQEAREAGDSAEAELSARYGQWRQSHRYVPIFSAIALAEAREGNLTLRQMNLETGFFADSEWPAAWAPIQERFQERLSGEPWRERRPWFVQNATSLVLPYFGEGGPGGPPRDGPRSFGPRPGRDFPGFRRPNPTWAIFDLNLPYVREIVLPELLRRHLGAGAEPDYEAEVVTRTEPLQVLYRSDPDQRRLAARNADATVNLFEVQYERLFRPRGQRGRNLDAGMPPGRPPALARPNGLGRWELLVRHKAGSLDAVVSHARMRNLIVTSGVFVLMIASIWALASFTRRAQRLARLQMEFVAGVSHELRTPLTVIHTAAYNLRGRVATNPAQVERYGALIQKESGRLKDLVEQVLRFAGSGAGRTLHETEPLSVESVIEEAVESSRTATEGFTVEVSVEPGLPQVFGDRVALKHALENLLGNAAKYGAGAEKWIGVSASRATGNGRDAIEIRVADRGPGIPHDEQRLIFDPFYRGRRAVQDQIHGTGLGLSLVKNIVAAHGGSVRVKSEAGKGTEFMLTIPAAQAEQAVPEAKV